MTPLSMDGYKLLHDSALVFADIEATGIRMDVKYLHEQDIAVGNDILGIERQLWKTSEAKEWKLRFKDKIKFSATAQLSEMLFKQWKYKPTKTTRKGRASVDDEVLRKINSPFTRLILQHRKLSTVRNTFLSGLLENQLNGFLHPSFNLHTVLSYRGSCHGPNFQNQPVRDPVQGEIVRKAFLPLIPEHQFGEIDYKGNEVVSNACYNHDPNLVAYIKDPTKDMHEDSAKNCFILQPKQIGEMIRYVGKNGFTFPEFYGSYFINIAPAMWWAITEHGLTTEDGIPLYLHLRNEGISNEEEFIDHIQQVEQHFWDERFPTFAKWKVKWYEAYQRKGYFDLLTGFRCQGPMRKNEVCNYPGQGTAFHFLLWGMVRLHEWLVNNEMKTQILGEIHDSIAISFHPDETMTVLRKARKIMCEDIRKHWKWINVPMSIEAEVAPVGKSWQEKQPMEIS